MQTLGEIAQETFLFVRATDGAATTLDRIAGTERLTHLVIRGSCPGAAATDPVFYLWDADEANVRLSDDEASSVESALELHLDESLPLHDVEDPVLGAETPCLVASAGHVVGFVDHLRVPKVVRGPEAAAQEAQVSLETECPDRLLLGQEGILRVALWLEEQGLGLPQVPIGEILTLRLFADCHIAPKDADPLGVVERSLRVVDPPDEPLALELLAIEPGLARLRLLLIYRGMVVGQSILRISVESQVRGMSGDESGESEAENDSQSAGPKSDNRDRILLPQRVPDLTLWILERRDETGLRIDFELSAADPELGLNRKRWQPKRWTSGETEALVEDLFYRLGQDTDDPRVWELEGLRLFEQVFPPDLQSEIWRLRKHIHYVQIQSEEAWLPWELCRLSGRDEDGFIKEGGFLCEEFAATRWRPGLPQKSFLSMRNLAVIMPDDELEASTLELPRLQALSATGCRITRVEPAALAQVEQALMSGRFDVYHFSCHGESGTDQEASIRLRGGERLTPSHIAGRVANLGLTQPVVVLNACHSARQRPVMGQADGWIRRFLDVGCSAFVGTYWAVEDRAAIRFTAAFYEHLMAGSPVADAVRAGRLEAKKEGGNSWLAYTAYAYPLACRPSEEEP